VGHALLSEVEREVRSRGGRLLLVETSSMAAYARARHLYETSGYRREAVVRNFYARGDDLMIYVKDLRAAPSGQQLAAVYQEALADAFAQPPSPPAH
jgi:ribosomal protein S18 acetylase RimI-like enzyme